MPLELFSSLMEYEASTRINFLLFRINFLHISPRSILVNASCVNLQFLSNKYKRYFVTSHNTVICKEKFL